MLADPKVSTIYLDGNITLSNKLDVNRKVTIEGNGYSLSKGIQVSASDVVLRGLTITPSVFYTTEDGDWYYGIMVGDVTGVVIENSKISGPAGKDAIGISDTTAGENTQFTVRNTVISDVWVGIIVDSPNTAATLTGNTISDAKYAFYVTQAEPSQVITGNVIKDPKAFSDGSKGIGIVVPAATTDETVASLKSSNTFVNVEEDNKVVKLAIE